MLLMIDNYDSFTYNLVQYFGELGQEVQVYRNDKISIEEIEKLESLLGKKAKITNLPFHKADIKETWADITKADEILDWRPQISLDDGLAQCVRWYKDNLPWSSEIKLP